MSGVHIGLAVVINYMFLNFICDQAWRLKAVARTDETALKRCHGVSKFTTDLQGECLQTEVIGGYILQQSMLNFYSVPRLFKRYCE